MMADNAIASNAYQSFVRGRGFVYAHNNQQRCYQDQGVRDQDQTKTRQAETKTKTKTRQTETETENKTREAETKTKTKTSVVETKTKTKTSKKWS